MPNEDPVIITLDYPPELGGTARYLAELVRASKKNIRVFVPAPHGLDGPGDVIQVEMFRDRWPWWFPIIRLCRSLRNRTSNIIISHILPVGTAAMISRWFGGPKYILICHGLDVRLAASSVWRRQLFMLICWNANCVVANSQSTAAFIKKITGVNAVIVTPAVSDITFPTRDQARTRLSIASDEHVILSVARLIERKNVDTVIQALSHIPPHDRIRLVVIGNGPESHRLQQLAKFSPHQVQFFTNASDAFVAEWYAASDVFCLPVKETSEDVEGFGIVFLEASLAGIPVIAGKTGGAVEAVVDRETGILVNPYDVRGVTQALTLVLGDKELRRKMGASGRERALRDFRWEDRWKQFEEIMKSGKKCYEP